MQTTEVREEELEPEEEEEEESGFLVLGEYSWSSGSSTEVFSPSCFSWSSRYDLLALSSSTGTLSVHRLDWRTIPAPISATALVSAVAWSPSSSNSRVLAVGTAAGTVEAICSETGTLLWQTRLPNPINSLHWAELTLPSSDTTRTSSETKGTGGVSNITHVDDALLHVTDERHTNSLVVAVAGDLELMLDDGFRLATVSLGYSTCRLQKVLVDPCLRWIVLASGDPLFVIKVRMDAIRDNMDEIKVVSNCWKRIQTSLERIRTVASEIIRIWKPARTRFESKMSLLLDQMKNFGDDEYWTPENIMIDYLFSGIGGEAVHQFFGKELEVTNLARLEEAVVGALTKVASTLFPDLKKSIRELIKIISELLERSKIPKFQYVGLVESSLNSFLEAASMLLLNFEASFVMVIDCLQRYSLFFEWIVLCCKSIVLIFIIISFLLFIMFCET